MSKQSNNIHKTSPNEAVKEEDIIEKAEKGIESPEQIIEEATQDPELSLPNTNDGRYILYGLIVIFLMFVIVGGWSATAELKSGVPVPGQVVVEGENKIIQSPDGGVVDKIYVDTGDHVKKGQLLVLLNTTKLQSSYDYFYQNYLDQLASKSRLQAENKGESEVSFPNEIIALPAVKKEKVTQPQISIFENDMQTLNHNRQVAKEQIQVLENKIAGLKESITSKQAMLASYEAEAKDQQELFDAHLTDIKRLRDLRRQIESLKADIAQAESQIRSAEGEIQKTRTKLKLDEEQFFKKIKETLVQTETKLSETQAKLKTLHYQLSHAKITSPIDGTVLNIKVNTVGAVIKPAESIMEIVPNDSKLIIQAKLSPQYIDYVHPGLDADLMFPAFRLKDTFMPVIPGKVFYVAADSTIDKKTGRSYYQVKLEVTSNGLKTLQKDHFKLTAGMPANVIIKIGHQTVLEYLLKPILVMAEKAFLEN